MKLNIYTLRTIALCSLLFTMWACDKDKNDDPEPEPEAAKWWAPKDCPEHPQWQLDIEPGSDSRPSWTCHYSSFSQTMAMQLSIKGGLLAQYVSDSDIMGAFIDGECRGVSNTRVSADGEPYFPIVIGGNVGDAGSVTIKYYCASLNRIFVYEDYVQFDASASPSSDNYPIDFVAHAAGLEKIYIGGLLTEETDFTIGINDDLAVTDESGKCCGLLAGIGDAENELFFYAYGLPKVRVYIRYYSYDEQKIYTLKGEFIITDGKAYKQVLSLRLHE